MSYNNYNQKGDASQGQSKPRREYEEDEDEDDGEYHHNVAHRWQRRRPPSADAAMTSSNDIDNTDDDRKPAAVAYSNLQSNSNYKSQTVEENDAVINSSKDVSDYDDRMERGGDTDKRTHQSSELTASTAPHVSTNSRHATLEARFLAKAAYEAPPLPAVATDDEKQEHHQQQHGRAVRRRSSLPGAEYVSSRAPGLSPAFYLNIVRRARGAEPTPGSMEQPESEFADEAVIEVNLSTNDHPALSKSQYYTLRCKMALAAALAAIFLAAAIGLGVGLGSKNNSNNGVTDVASNSNVLSAFTNDCQMVRTQQQPNILSQCLCNGTIYAVSDEIVTKYQQLIETFLPTISASSNVSLFQLQSCSPPNQALVWLASGDGSDATIVSSSSSSSSTHPSVNLQQRYSLALLFILWNGPSWDTASGWLSSDNECTWYGVTCADSEQIVTDLALSSNHLVGGLTGDIAQLVNLTNLALDGNNFQNSPIPSEIGLLTNLQYLVLSSSSIRGSLPTEFFMLGNALEIFQADNNQLTGTVSTLLGDMLQLDHLIMSNNNLTGTIPTEIGLCANASYIQIDNNHFDGTIPTQVGLMDQLVVFSANNNQLNGTIPAQFSSCTYLETLLLGNNRLHGTLSTALASLTSLTSLDLLGNQISGTTPTAICQMTSSSACQGSCTCEGCDCPSR